MCNSVVNVVTNLVVMIPEDERRRLRAELHDARQVYCASLVHVYIWTTGYRSRRNCKTPMNCVIVYYYNNTIITSDYIVISIGGGFSTSFWRGEGGFKIICTLRGVIFVRKRVDCIFIYAIYMLPTRVTSNLYVYTKTRQYRSCF